MNILLGNIKNDESSSPLWIGMGLANPDAWLLTREGGA